MAQVRDHAAAAAPAPGVEDAVAGRQRAEVGGEQLGLGVFEAVQFTGEAFAAPDGVRLVQYGPVGLPDAVVVVVQVVDLAELQVDRVLLGVPVVRDAGLVRGVGRHERACGGDVRSGQR